MTARVTRGFSLTELTVATALLLAVVGVLESNEPGMGLGLYILSMLGYALVRFVLYCHKHLHPSIWRMRRDARHPRAPDKSESTDVGPPGDMT